MKNILKITLLMLVFYTCTKITSSKYCPFLVQDKIWITGIFGDQTLKKNYMKVGNDTSINGFNYCKLFILEGEDSSNWQENGYLREKSKRIYYKQQNEKEILLYDFSLNKGDKIELSSAIYSVDSVKYLTILNNEIRKHIFLSHKNGVSKNHVVWIEGIGSIYGFFCNTGNNQINSCNLLLSCEENGTFLYIDSAFEIKNDEI